VKVSNSIHFTPRAKAAPAQTAVGQVEPKPQDHVQLSGGGEIGPFNLEALKQQTKGKAARLARHMAPHRSGQVLMKLPPGQDFSGSDRQQFFDDFKFTASRELTLNDSMNAKCGGRYYLAELPRNLTVAEAIAALEADGRALMAEPNHIVTRDQVVIDSSAQKPTEDQYEPPQDAPIDLRNSQWNLHNEGQTGGVPGAHVSALDAWRESKGEGVTIAFMDTGIDLDNPDLQPNLWVNPGEIADDGVDNDGNGYIDDIHGINLVERDKTPDDDNGHGSYNASVVAAVEGNSSDGLVGLAPQAKMMSIKFMEGSGRGDIAHAIEGISYAENHGARIILNGWMSRTQNQSLFEIIEASKALHVCSAGNDGYDNDLRPAHPASFPLENVVSVAATDHHDDFTRFTNRGAHSVDLAAPGRKVPVYEQGGDLTRQGGASIASAHVAAAGALVVSKFPDITNEALATRLIYNGEVMPEDADRISSGRRLNAAKALRNDVVAPATPGGFSVEAVDGSNLKLTFHSVSDNGGISKEPVAFYEARIASRPIVADGEAGGGLVEFSDATPVPMDIARDMLPGKEVNSFFAVGASGTERNFHLAIRATDKVGNHSELSQASVNIPKSRVLFEEGFELEAGAPDGWSLDGDWARVPFHGRGTIVTDSPDGDYDNNVDASLTSPVIDLSDVSNAKLHFDSRYTIEPKHDACHVEIEVDGWFGKKWKKLSSLDGFSDWKSNEIDLSRYTGKPVRLRFRMDTDRDRVAYGVQLDHLSISTTDRDSESV
jgi:subtilisin family serine protease